MIQEIDETNHFIVKTWKSPRQQIYKKEWKFIQKNLTLNLMLPHVVLTNVTKHSFEIHGLFYSDLLHATSQFMTPRSTLKDLDNNCSQLVTATSLDPQIFCMHASSS